VEHLLRGRAAVTRDQQVQAALRLLSPDPERREECERAINEALDWMARETHDAILSTRKYKAVLERYRKALARLELERNALLQLERGIGSAPPLDLNPSKMYCDAQLRQPPARLALRLANPKYYAAWQARNLLQEWSRRRITKTRGGPWAKLAAILYGDQRADLFRNIQGFRPRLLV
jgi:hypothetical protein